MNVTIERAYALRTLLVKAAAGLSDEDALQCTEFYDSWTAGTKYIKNDRLRHAGKLWRVEQPELVADNLYPPGSPGTEALYSEVAHPGQGDTPDNPIAYDNNMELVEGKYYSQNSVTYICTRSTGIPVYNDLADLVGLYVEIWTGG